MAQNPWWLSRWKLSNCITQWYSFCVAYTRCIATSDPDPPRPGLWYKCSLCKSFYAIMYSTRKWTTIGLIYRWGLHHWEFESVRKCLEPPESFVKWNRLYCTCILLHCWEFTKHVWKGWLLSQDQNDKRKYEDLAWTRPRIGSHDNFVKTKDILSRFKDHFWSVMLMMFHLNVFYLPVLKHVVRQYKMWNDVMFWFSQI